MIAYLFRRILAAIPVVLFVSLIVFSLLYLVPGDPAAMLAGDQATPADIEMIRASLNLDEPYLVRFFNWLGQIASGDLGLSIYSGQPIAGMVLQRIETTLSLMTLAMTFAVLFSVPLGVMAAWRYNSFIDRFATAVAVIGFSVPTFVIGYMLAWFFGLQLRWLPVQGYTSISEGVLPWLRSLVLPALALSTAFIGLLTRMTRATMLEVLSQDYIQTARAKGLSTRQILFSHALKNSAVPITTVVGLGVAGLIAGSVVTETVFALPGLGRLTADAILRRDYPVIQSMILLFSISYVLINLLVDVLYTVFDPRVRY